MQGAYIKRSTIDVRVMRIVAEQLGVKEEAMAPNASFVEDYGADYLDTVDLIIALEDEFDIEIPDEDAAKLTTVQAVIDYITDYRA